jgi:DNA-directed RNA polymerase subunit RPC12/RpoP
MGMSDALDLVKDAKPAPVRREVHAKWKPYDACETEENVYECTNCGFVLQLMEGTPESNEYIGCPRCLARMDGDAHD